MPSKSEKAIASIKSQCSILSKLKVPFIFASKPGITVVSFGTKKTKELFNNKEEEFSEAFIEDIKSLCEPEHLDSSSDVVEERRKEIYDRLTTPLTLANAREVKKYARYLILEDFKERNPLSKDANIKYGCGDWEAGFWPNDMLVWTNIKDNFSNIRKSDVPGKISVTAVLRQAIKNALEAKELDPENFFDSNKFNKDMEKKRKRNRGIHDVPTITENICSPPHDVSGVEFTPRRPAYNAAQPTISATENSHINLGLDSALDIDDLNDLIFQSAFEEEECLGHNYPDMAGGCVGSSQNVEDDIPVPNRPHLTEKVPCPNGERYFPLPSYLQELAPNMKIRYNDGGGICLTLAIAQFCNVDVYSLKRYTAQFTIDNWIRFKETIIFPMCVIIGTGDNSHRKIIEHQYDYFSFLKSDESLYAFNTGETEIASLATIIQQSYILYNKVFHQEPL